MSPEPEPQKYTLDFDKAYADHLQAESGIKEDILNFSKLFADRMRVYTRIKEAAIARYIEAHGGEPKEYVIAECGELFSVTESDWVEGVKSKHPEWEYIGPLPHFRDSVVALFKKKTPERN